MIFRRAFLKANVRKYVKNWSRKTLYLNANLCATQAYFFTNQANPSTRIQRFSCIWNCFYSDTASVHACLLSPMSAPEVSVYALQISVYDFCLWICWIREDVRILHIFCHNCITGCNAYADLYPLRCPGTYRVQQTFLLDSYTLRGRRYFFILRNKILE